MSNPTAAIIIIGDEILSGRTKDKNIGWLAEQLNMQGIQLREVRVIPDIREVIIDTVKSMSDAVDLVFTSGGRGHSGPRGSSLFLFNAQSCSQVLYTVTRMPPPQVAHAANVFTCINITCMQIYALRVLHRRVAASLAKALGLSRRRDSPAKADRSMPFFLGPTESPPRNPWASCTARRGSARRARRVAAGSCCSRARRCAR